MKKSKFLISITPEFDGDLKEYMRKMKITQKTVAIRLAMRDAVSRLRDAKRKTDFRSWIGMGLKAPLNPNPRFKSDDDLWEST